MVRLGMSFAVVASYLPALHCQQLLARERTLFLKTILLTMVADGQSIKLLR